MSADSGIAEHIIQNEDDVDDQENKTYSVKDVMSHRTDDDCWIVINGHVYNVTNFLQEHPGGADILLSLAGTDCTEPFNDVGHSLDARKHMKNYCIGKVRPDSQARVKTLDTLAGDVRSETNSARLRLFIPALVLVLSILTAVLAYFVWMKDD